MSFDQNFQELSSITPDKQWKILFQCLLVNFWITSTYFSVFVGTSKLIVWHQHAQQRSAVSCPAVLKYICWFWENCGKEQPRNSVIQKRLLMAIKRHEKNRGLGCITSNLTWKQPGEMPSGSISQQCKDLHASRQRQKNVELRVLCIHTRKLLLSGYGKCQYSTTSRDKKSFKNVVTKTIVTWLISAQSSAWHRISLEA